MAMFDAHQLTTNRTLRIFQSAEEVRPLGQKIEAAEVGFIAVIQQTVPVQHLVNGDDLSLGSLEYAELLRSLMLQADLFLSIFRYYTGQVLNGSVQPLDRGDLLFGIC